MLTCVVLQDRVVAGVATSARPMVHGGIIVELYIVRREWKRRQKKKRK